MKDFELYGSNNDSDWDQLLSDTVTNSDSLQTFEVSNSTAYRYYKIIITSTYYEATGDQASFIELALYEALTLTGNYGSDICSGGTPTTLNEYNSSYSADKAFDNNNTTYAHSSGVPDWWAKYDLGVGNGKIVNKYSIRSRPDDTGSWAFKDWTLQGSNNDSDWDTLDTRTNEYFGVGYQRWFTLPTYNSTSYRYYRIYVTDTRSPGSYVAVAEIEFLELHLQCFSEDTIKEQGSYSLKVIAKATDSLNDTLTKTFDSPLDLSGQDKILIDIRASRTGTNIQVQIYDSGGTTSTHNIEIDSADTFQEEEWNISGIDSANLDSIETIAFKIINADADNLIYIDNIYAGTSGWTGKICGVTNPSKICGVLTSGIGEV